MPEEPDGSSGLDASIVGISDRLVGTVTDHMPGIMLTGMVFVAEYIDDSGDRGWMFAGLPEQSTAYSLGLVEWARAVVRTEIPGQLLGDDEED